MFGKMFKPARTCAYLHVLCQWYSYVEAETLCTISYTYAYAICQTEFILFLCWLFLCRNSSHSKQSKNT